MMRLSLMAARSLLTVMSTQAISFTYASRFPTPLVTMTSPAYRSISTMVPVAQRPSVSIFLMPMSLTHHRMAAPIRLTSTLGKPAITSLPTVSAQRPTKVTNPSRTPQPPASALWRLIWARHRPRCSAVHWLATVASRAVLITPRVRSRFCALQIWIRPAQPVRPQPLSLS